VQYLFEVNESIAVNDSSLNPVGDFSCNFLAVLGKDSSKLTVITQGLLKKLRLTVKKIGSDSSRRVKGVGAVREAVLLPNKG